MSVNISGPVDAYGNISANPPITQVEAGFVTLQAEPDPGGTTGTRLVRALDITDDFRLRVGEDVIVLQDVFIGAAINTALWFQNATTMTITVASGFLNLNAGAAVAINNVARVQSYRTLPVYHTFPTYFEFLAVYQTVNPTPPANNVTEMGVGFASGVAAPTDGAFFRWTTTGVFEAVISYGGVETSSVALTPPSIGIVHHYIVSVTTNKGEFWIDGVLVASLDGTAAGAPTTTSSVNLPVLMRTYNSGVPAAAVILKVAEVSCSFGDQGPSRPWEVCMVGQGQSAIQGQTGGTMGSTSNNTNSAAPAAATLSNVAAGYATLGGQFTFVSVAGAETDYALFAFLIPAGTSTLAGKNLYITGVRISSFVAGAAVATTATVLQWTLGVGCTGVSLATAEAAGGKSPRRLNLGVQSFPVGAAIGADAVDISRTFSSPQFVEQGTYVHIILKMPIATATASQSIRGVVSIEGFFE